jgi:signal transduction histidine kinase
MTSPHTGKNTTTNVWDRWDRAMNPVFYGLLAFGLISALADRLADGPFSWTFVSLTSGLSLFLGVWYWYVVVRPGPQAIRGSKRALVYFAVAVPVFAALTYVHPGFMFISFIFYWHNFSFFTTLPSVLGAALLTMTLVWSSAGPGDVGLVIQQPGALPVFVMTLLVSAVLATFIGSIIGQSRKRQALIEELEETRRELAAQERRAGTLEERGRLAREIHDTLAQGFTSIVAHLEASEAALPPGAETSRRHLDLARRTARDNLVEARHLVAALRPEILAGSSLPEALGRLTDRWSEETNVAATLTVTGEQRPLPQEHQVALLRAAQEALSNTRKHANARNVTATLSYMDDAVALDVQDDGSGFDRAQLSPETNDGFGLRAMRERVEDLGGSLTVETEPGAGATLAVELPIEVSGHGLQASEKDPEAET